jgi:hypothetical protein
MVVRVCRFYRVFFVDGRPKTDGFLTGNLSGLGQDRFNLRQVQSTVDQVFGRSLDNKFKF